MKLSIDSREMIMEYDIRIQNQVAIRFFLGVHPDNLSCLLQQFLFDVLSRLLHGLVDRRSDSIEVFSFSHFRILPLCDPLRTRPLCFIALCFHHTLWHASPPYQSEGLGTCFSPFFSRYFFAASSSSKVMW